MIDLRIVELELEQRPHFRSWQRVHEHQLADFLERSPDWHGCNQRQIPVCQCCGSLEDIVINERDIMRCRKHIGRNPCAIDGCKRSFRSHQGCYYSNEAQICGTHWRALVPVGSPERRVLQRVNRAGKKFGWTPAMIQREGRIWNRIVKLARARAAGDVDMDEVNRLFGWDQAA